MKFRFFAGMIASTLLALPLSAHPKDLAQTIHSLTRQPLIEEDLRLLEQQACERMLSRVQEKKHYAIAPSEIPIERALALTTLSTSAELQYQDDLKRRLAKLASRNWAIVMFESTEIDRELMTGSFDDLIENIDAALEVLPKEEVATRFYFDCCKQALKYLKSHETGFLVEGFLKFAGGEKSGLFDMLLGASSNITKYWYRHTWDVEWLALAVTDLTTLDQLLGKFLTELDKRSEKAEDYYSLACSFALIDLLDRLIEAEAPLIAEGLEKKVLYKYLHSLLKHASWQVRYVVAEAFTRWKDHPQHGKNLLKALCTLAKKEKSPEIKHLLASALGQ